MTVEIEVTDDPPRACAALLLGAVLAGGQLALAGGTTPRAAYRELARTLRAVGHDPGGATLWFGDERCVPPDDERSNYRMVAQTLLDPLADLPRPSVHRIEGERGPHAGADAYEARLRDAGEPEFDLVLLGIGPDGHTASLFPGQPSLRERSRLAVGVEQPGHEPFVARVTLTLPALTRARRVVFLATGEEKADAVAAAFGRGATPDPRVPASLVAPLASELTVLLDPAAARRL